MHTCKFKKKIKLPNFTYFIRTCHEKIFNFIYSVFFKKGDEVPPIGILRIGKWIKRKYFCITQCDSVKETLSATSFDS